MIGVVLPKIGKSGGFAPEPDRLEFKKWDFGQKKAPSVYFIFLIY